MPTRPNSDPNHPDTLRWFDETNRPLQKAYRNFTVDDRIPPEVEAAMNAEEQAASWQEHLRRKQEYQPPPYTGLPLAPDEITMLDEIRAEIEAD
jgi:hypothetical protein